MTTEILECGHAESPHSGFTRGYGTDAQGSRYCYECCADRDREQMNTEGRITLYWTGKQYIAEDRYGYGEVTNWPGSLRYKVSFMKQGRHNFAGVRYDVWFRANGANWHGVQYGDNTQVVHCKRTA